MHLSTKHAYPLISAAAVLIACNPVCITSELFGYSVLVDTTATIAIAFIAQVVLVDPVINTYIRSILARFLPNR